jgi:chaperone modulatory protein CbpM
LPGSIRAPISAGEGVSEMLEIREVRVVGDADWIAAAEVCRLCRLDLEAVIELAELGLVAPRGYSPQEWQLPAAAVPRLSMAGRLMRDLGINVSGAVLAVELLETQRDLERQLRRLERLAHS